MPRRAPGPFPRQGYGRPARFLFGQICISPCFGCTLRNGLSGILGSSTSPLVNTGCTIWATRLPPTAAFRPRSLRRFPPRRPRHEADQRRQRHWQPFYPASFPGASHGPFRQVHDYRSRCRDPTLRLRRRRLHACGWPDRLRGKFRWWQRGADPVASVAARWAFACRHPAERPSPAAAIDPFAADALTFPTSLAVLFRPCTAGSV